MRRDYNDHMKSGSIGIREAKAQLSRLVREAQQGSEWIITERGRPVARLSAVDRQHETLDDRLERLRRRGWIGPKREGPALIRPPTEVAADMQRALQEDRGD